MAIATTMEHRSVGYRRPGRVQAQGGLAGDGGSGRERTPDQRGQVSGHAREFAQVGFHQRLRAVAQRRLRVRVDVDDDAVGADRDGGPRQRHDQVAAAAGMRRVHDHGQVRQPLDDRDRADVQGVPGGLLEGPDAALAEHDVEVAALGDVLRGHQPLLDGGVHAALEHDRLAHAADRLQQREVLHVAGADLQHVGVAGDQVHVGRVDHLGHDREAGRRAAPRRGSSGRPRPGPGTRTASCAACTRRRAAARRLRPGPSARMPASARPSRRRTARR